MSSFQKGIRLEIDRNSIVSIHDQLVAHFSEEISCGRYAPGDRLPSENELARRFGVNRLTVRRAFDTLVYARLLSRRQGRGTFVAAESSGLIGFVGQTLISGISSELVSQLNWVLNERQLDSWHLLVCGANNDPDRQLRYTETLRNNGVRGIILAPAVLEQYHRNGGTLRSLRRSGLPFVLIERYVQDAESDYVVSANYKAGSLAARHLLELGHRRIALIDGLKIPSIQQRCEGFKDALEEYGIPFEPSLVLSWPDHMVGIDTDGLAELLEQGATALYVYTDQGATQVLDWCAASGVRVPEDLAIVGTGDLHMVRNVRPRLTTVRHDFRAMASMALEILMDQIELRQAPDVCRQETIDVELVVRDTCGGNAQKPLLRGRGEAAEPLMPCRIQTVNHQKGGVVSAVQSTSVDPSRRGRTSNESLTAGNGY